MYSHVTLGSNDVAASVAFYDAVLAELGIERFHFDGTYAAGYRTNASPSQFWVLRPFDQGDSHPGNGWHVAFLAETRAQVDAFHAKALAEGASDEGAPGPRPQYHEHYYGAYVRDPQGNKIQAACHAPASD